MSKTRGEYGSGVARPKIDANAQFELKGQFLKELRDNTFSGSEHEDANEHIKKVLEIVDLFHIPNVTQDQIMLSAFPVSLAKSASNWLRNEPASAIPTKTDADAKVAIQEMAEYSQKWHNGTSSKNRSTETSDELAAIQAQLNSLGREIKKVNEKVYDAQDVQTFYAKELPISSPDPITPPAILTPSSQIRSPSSSSTTLSNSSRNQTCDLVSPSSSIYTPTPPQIFEIGKSSVKMHLKHHEEQIEDILNYLDELYLHHIEKMEEGRIDRMIIRRNSNKLKTELKKIRTQIIKLQKKQLGQKDKIAFAYYRISNLEQIIEKIQARHQTDQEDL
ncbi:hypothetical protein Tco_1253819 [Tanacetum coccineum]